MSVCVAHRTRGGGPCTGRVGQRALRAHTCTKQRAFRSERQHGSLAWAGQGRGARDGPNGGGTTSADRSLHAAPHNDRQPIDLSIGITAAPEKGEEP